MPIARKHLLPDPLFFRCIFSGRRYHETRAAGAQFPPQEHLQRAGIPFPLPVENQRSAGANAKAHRPQRDQDGSPSVGGEGPRGGGLMAPRPFECWFGVGRPDGDHSMVWKIWAAEKQPTFISPHDPWDSDRAPPRLADTPTTASAALSSVWLTWFAESDQDDRPESSAQLSSIRSKTYISCLWTSGTQMSELGRSRDLLPEANEPSPSGCQGQHRIGRGFGLAPFASSPRPSIPHRHFGGRSQGSC